MHECKNRWLLLTAMNINCSLDNFFIIFDERMRNCQRPKQFSAVYQYWFSYNWIGATIGCWTWQRWQRQHCVHRALHIVTRPVRTCRPCIQRTANLRQKPKLLFMNMNKIKIGKKIKLRRKKKKGFIFCFYFYLVHLILNSVWSLIQILLTFSSFLSALDLKPHFH